MGTYSIYSLKEPGAASKVVREAVKQGVQTVVAIGGDGTINQIAKVLVNTPTSLGIIPAGSGNGLARHLKIPLNIKKAIKLLSNGKVIQIDTCTINDQSFFCAAGIGFDAAVGKLFAKSKNRGFITYLWLGFTQFLNYVPQNYKLLIDGKEINTKALLITFANSCQYGNNAYIAPEANIQDGYFQICLLCPFTLIHTPGLVFRLFNKSIHHSKFMVTYKAKSVTIEREKPASIHYDGEPAQMGKGLQIKIKPASLSVIVPD